MPLLSSLQKDVQGMAPGYFAVVMATGIVSIAAHLLQFRLIAGCLLWLNIFFFCLLLLLFLLRLLFYFSSFRADLSTHGRGAGFLTLVAGTALLGNQLNIIWQAYNSALLLFFFALGAWLVLVYSFCIRAIIGVQKPSAGEGLNGSWLLLTVSTQSLSILSALLAPVFPLPVKLVLFGSLAFYLLGLLFYIVLITLIFYRLLFYPVKAEAFQPTYWIDMGAAAITTLSGATLAKMLPGVPEMGAFIPVLKVFGLLTWVAGSWWIPIVLIIELWRHRRVPLRYHSSYWSLVFPMGTYAVCTLRLSEAFNASFLQPVALVFFSIAMVTWLGTFTGMCKRFAGRYFAKV